MGNFIDTSIVVFVLLFLGVIIWSRVMKQTMTETILEIKTIMFGEKEE